jgi:SAM-dependent methyltransferase
MKYNFKQKLKNELKYIFAKNWTMKEVGEHWDETTNYDDINEKTYTYFRRFTDANNLFDLPEKQYTLDICSRTGNGSIFFSQKGKIYKVICADVTEKMQKICEKNLTENKINFELKYFLDYPLPFSDNEFDLILNFETIEHMSSPEIFFSEICRVLKNNGLIVLTTPNIIWEPIHWIAAIFNIHHSEGPHRFIQNRKIKKWIKKENLKIIKYKTSIIIPCGPKFIIEIGEFLEKYLPSFITNLIGLRRIYILQK